MLQSKYIFSKIRHFLCHVNQCLNVENMTDVFIFVISHCVAILWEEIIWCSNTLGRNRAPAAHLYLNSTLLDPTSNRYLNCQFILDSFIILATLSSDASSVEVVSHKGWAPAKKCFLSGIAQITSPPPPNAPKNFFLQESFPNHI